MIVALICDACGEVLRTFTERPGRALPVRVPLCPVCSKRIADTAHAEGSLDAEERLTESFRLSGDVG